MTPTVIVEYQEECGAITARGVFEAETARGRKRDASDMVDKYSTSGKVCVTHYKTDRMSLRNAYLSELLYDNTLDVKKVVVDCCQNTFAVWFKATKSHNQAYQPSLNIKSMLNHRTVQWHVFYPRCALPPPAPGRGTCRTG